MLMGIENQTIGLAFACCILYQKQKTFVVEHCNVFLQLSFSLQECHSQSLLQLLFNVYANTHTRTEDRNQYVPAAKRLLYSKSALQCRNTELLL